MKKLSVCVMLFVISYCGFSQKAIDLFVATDPSIKESVDLELVGEYSLLSLSKEKQQQLLDEQFSHIQISIPFNSEILVLDLQETKLTQEGFIVRTASGKELTWAEHSKSMFYHGEFEGYPNSHFAFSVLENEIIGIGNIPGIGDVNLAKAEGMEWYAFVPESSVAGRNTFSCDTRGEATRPTGGGMDSREVIEDCSGVYFEVDFDIFEAKGGAIAAADYMLALFSEVQLLYDIDGMTIYISDMKVWDEVSPYYGLTDTNVLLDLFGTTTTIWEGDLGHLVTNAASGGLAWVDVFCSPNQAIRKAVSGIGLSYEPVPVYSWSVEVIAHEMGHNMGSPHTHACFWNDDMTAIDGCGPEAGFDEGCDAPLPPEGGTVMSYCHLTAVGIDLGLGFGEQPGNLLRETILESDCLTSCDLTEMDITTKSGVISPTCENGPIYSKVTIVNNSNVDFTYCTLEIYINGDLEMTYPWAGYIAEGAKGTIGLPTIALPLGTYSMEVVITAPNGYEDENTLDNDYTFNFEVTPYPYAAFIANPDEVVSYDAEVQMTNLSTGAVSYKWDFDDGSDYVVESDPLHVFPFEKGGLYEVSLFAASDKGCIDTAKAEVNVIGVNIYYIPNTFVPYNNPFKPVFSAGLDVYDYHLTIFNRYGEVVFESYDATVGWDGMYGNRKAPTGVYVWSLEFGDTHSDEKHTELGHVNLLR